MDEGNSVPVNQLSEERLNLSQGCDKVIPCGDTDSALEDRPAGHHRLGLDQINCYKDKLHMFSREIVRDGLRTDNKVHVTSSAGENKGILGRASEDKGILGRVSVDKVRIFRASDGMVRQGRISDDLDHLDRASEGIHKFGAQFSKG